MKDNTCVAFLQWALPHLDMRWAGFRKVRRQVCRRLGQRLHELGLSDLNAYRHYLERRPEEWRAVDDACRITISRFYRDHGVYETLKDDILPVLAGAAVARGAHRICCLSIGCASGEEVYSLKLVWELNLADRFDTLSLTVSAVDSHPAMLARARRACYSKGSLKELPGEWIDIAFDAVANGELCLRERFRQGISFVHYDVRKRLPRGPFDLILCRNLVFTYFREPLQIAILGRLHERIRDGGALVVGAHESVPPPHSRFRPWDNTAGVYQRVPMRSR